MLINKFFKKFLFILFIYLNIFKFFLNETKAYPVFAQQNYSNPRAANGKLACANCHLNQKAIEVETPQAVLPNSIFEVEIKVPYNVNQQQIGSNGKKIDLNVGGILILPKGFKLAPKNQISQNLKAKTKGIFISPYSTEFDNILVVGPISGKTHQELIFPVISPDPEKNSNIKYLTYPIYAGGNRGRGQVYPTGEKSNINVFGANQTGIVTQINKTEKEDTNITILSSNGVKSSQLIPIGLDIIVKSGELVKLDQPLNFDPNAGGFGQEEKEIVLQNPSRIIAYLGLCFYILLTQILLILKKKQFEKIQIANLNF